MSYYPKMICALFQYLGFSPSSWFLFFYYNYISKKVVTKSRLAFINCTHSIIDIRKGASLQIGQNLLLGKHRTKGSKIETRLLLNEGVSLIIPQHYTIHAGSFIDVLRGAD